MSEKLKYLIRQRTLKPFIILVICSVIGFSSGTHHLFPYIVQILNAYQSPISPNWATIFIGFTGVCGTIVCIPIVKFVGKRRIFLVSLTVVFCINTLLGSSIHDLDAFIDIFCFNFKFFSRHLWLYLSTTECQIVSTYRNVDGNAHNKFDSTNFIHFASAFQRWHCISPVHAFGWNVSGEDSRSYHRNHNSRFKYIYFCCDQIIFWFRKLAKFTQCSVDLCSIRNYRVRMLILEVFVVFQPDYFRSFRRWSFNVAYKILPETEGCTLEDIELHFLDNSKSITDRNITRNQSNV